MTKAKATREVSNPNIERMAAAMRHSFGIDPDGWAKYYAKILMEGTEAGRKRRGAEGKASDACLAATAEVLEAVRAHDPKAFYLGITTGETRYIDRGMFDQGFTLGFSLPACGKEGITR